MVRKKYMSFLHLFYICIPNFKPFFWWDHIWKSYFVLFILPISQLLPLLSLFFQPDLTAVWLENWLNLKIGIFKWFERNTYHTSFLHMHTKFQAIILLGSYLKIRLIMGRSWEIGEMNNTKLIFKYDPIKIMAWNLVCM